MDCNRLEEKAKGKQLKKRGRKPIFSPEVIAATKARVDNVNSYIRGKNREAVVDELEKSRKREMEAKNINTIGAPEYGDKTVQRAISRSI